MEPTPTITFAPDTDAPSPGQQGVPGASPSVATMAPGQEVLPMTGPDAGWLVAIGLAVLLIGAMLITVCRRMRRT